MSAPADRPLTEEEARREADLALSRPIPVYDPRPFTPEQEARIKDIALRVYLIASGNISQEGFPSWAEARVSELWHQPIADTEESHEG